MVGIIGALDMEINSLVSAMEPVKKSSLLGVELWQGKLGREEVVVARCSVGKVNAAAATQTLLLEFGPELVINSGVAGGVAEGIGVNDIVVASAVVQHDADTTALGEPLGLVQGVGKVFLDCDKEQTAKLLAVAEEEARQSGCLAKLGVVATGDKFIADLETGKKISRQFGAAAAEMEGGSVGQVCARAGVKFCVLRVISDSIYGGNSGQSYQEFAKGAAEKSSEIIKRFLAKRGG